MSGAAGAHHLHRGVDEAALIRGAALELCSVAVTVSRGRSPSAEHGGSSRMRSYLPGSRATEQLVRPCAVHRTGAMQSGSPSRRAGSPTPASRLSDLRWPRPSHRALRAHHRAHHELTTEPHHPRRPQHHDALLQAPRDASSCHPGRARSRTRSPALGASTCAASIDGRFCRRANAAPRRAAKASRTIALACAQRRR